MPYSLKMSHLTARLSHVHQQYVHEAFNTWQEGGAPRGDRIAAAMMRDEEARAPARSLPRLVGLDRLCIGAQGAAHVIERGTARMLNRGLALGMTTWRGVVEELARSKAALKKGLSRLLNRELSRGFSAWREMAVGRASFLRKLRKGLGFIVNRQLALGWASWKDGVAELKEADAKKERKRNALLYMMYRELALGLSTWKAMWEERSRQMAALQKGLSRLLNRALSDGSIPGRSGPAAGGGAHRDAQG